MLSPQKLLSLIQQQEQQLQQAPLQLNPQEGGRWRWLRRVFGYFSRT